MRQELLVEGRLCYHRNILFDDMDGGVSRMRTALNDDVETILLDEEMIQAKVVELAQQIAKDYEGKTITIVCILKGAVMFAADLARALPMHVELDFMAISSYGKGVRPSGVVRILKDLDHPIEGKHVLVVEDIVDSGLTLSYLIESLSSRHPASLKTCVLLDKPERRVVDFTPDYLGFEIPDEFVIGYGLDYAEKYRNLPYIGVLKREVYEAAGDDA